MKKKLSLYSSILTVDYILKYGTGNLIIYYCTYSRLLGDAESGSQIDGWLEWSVICARRVKNI